MTDSLRPPRKRPTLPWWSFGLVGAVTLSLVMLANLLIAVLVRHREPVALWHAMGYVALVFAMGFVCGVIAWAGRGLHRRIGWIGDSIVGIVVMVVFFTMCILVFEPHLDGKKLENIGILLGIAVVIGAICGPWFARDLRNM